MNLRIAAALFAFLLFVPLATAQSYDLDLVAQDISFAPLENGRWLVSVDYEVRLGETAPAFSFVRRIELFRNGVSLQVLDNSTLSVVNGSNCISCLVGCSGTCEITWKGDNHRGTCKRTGTNFCDTEKTIRKCVCNAGESKSFVLDMIAGDGITLSLDPEPGVVDGDLTNNTLSAAL